MGVGVGFNAGVKLGVSGCSPLILQPPFCESVSGSVFAMMVPRQ